MATYKYNGIDIDTNNIKCEDMPTETFQEIFELCGAEVAVSLLINMPANSLSVPTNGMKKVMQKMIIKEYDGTTASIRRIGRKFKISETTIRAILNEAKAPTPAPGQIGLFD